MDSKLKNIGIKVEKTTDLKEQPVYKTEKFDDENEEEFDDDKIYDETMQDQDANPDDNKVEYRRKLSDIPTEMLPCPKKLSYEESFSPPTQDEVKYYKTSTSVRKFSSLVCIVLGFIAANLL